jgi:hypothetical protein
LALLCRLLLSCGLVVAVVACSPSPEEQRAEDQQAVAATFAPAFDSITTAYQTAMVEIQTDGRDALSSGDANEVLQVYKALRNASADAAADFAEITPPAAVSGQHESLVENLQQQADTLNDVVGAATQEQDAALTDGLTRLATLLADFTTIHQAIDRELAQAS